MALKMTRSFGTKMFRLLSNVSATVCQDKKGKSLSKGVVDSIPRASLSINLIYSKTDIKGNGITS